MTLSNETRAALARGIRALRLSRDHALFTCGCKKRAKKDRLAADALQALLDEGPRSSRAAELVERGE